MMASLDMLARILDGQVDDKVVKIDLPGYLPDEHGATVYIDPKDPSSIGVYARDKISQEMASELVFQRIANASAELNQYLRNDARRNGLQTDKYKWITADSSSAPTLSRSWIIKGVLPQEGLAVIFGKPGSGKSAFAADIALRVATGMNWNGIKVDCGPVSLLLSEGGVFAKNRVIAWCKQNDCAWPNYFRLLPDQINIFRDRNDVDWLINDIVKNQPGCRMIVVDTLARAIAGADENSAKDMGLIVARALEIGEATKALVVLLHHSGKSESSGSRGHSSLLGAADLEIEVSRKKGQPGEAKVTKLRDGVDGRKFIFQLEPVELGSDSEGEPVKAIVAVGLGEEVPGSTERLPNSGRNQEIVLKAFWELKAKRQSQNAFSGSAENSGISLDDLLGEAARLMPHGDKRARNRAAKEATSGLVDSGKLEVDGSLVRFVAL